MADRKQKGLTNVRKLKQYVFTYVMDRQWSYIVLRKMSRSIKWSVSPHSIRQMFIEVFLNTSTVSWSVILNTMFDLSWIKPFAVRKLINTKWKLCDIHYAIIICAGAVAHTTTSHVPPADDTIVSFYHSHRQLENVPFGVIIMQLL